MTVLPRAMARPAYGLPSALEGTRPAAECETLAMHLISDRRLRPRGAHLRIGKAHALLRCQYFPDSPLPRPVDQEHLRYCNCSRACNRDRHLRPWLEH